VTKTLTRTQRVYEALRTDILQGVRAPGSALRIQEIVDVHKVSMSVVREALVRLSEQHLVTFEPNVGFRVVEVSRVDLDDLVSTRIDLEGLALRRSIERGGLDWEARVISAHHVLDNTPMMASEAIGTTDEWTVAHTAFHEALESSCGSLRLSNFTRALRDSAEIYRQLSGRPNVGTRDIAGEHRELMELATARRAADAVESLRRHLMRTAEGVVREQFES
jgi:GntR family carbon starvation induced transcriptional regulator